MNRTASLDALVLRVKPSGEHREAFLLTAGEGIVRATVFGGPKSRLRSHVAPFNSGTVWLYHDPVKDSRKVSDFDVVSWRPGLRELYERSQAATTVAGALLSASGGGGSFHEALRLAAGVLDALENASQTGCARLTAAFLWLWAGILGGQPDPERCASCGQEPPDGEPLWFVRGEGMLCTNCYRRMYCGSSAPLGKAAGRWLASAAASGPAAAAAIELDSASLEEARILAEHVIAGLSA